MEQLDPQRLLAACVAELTDDPDNPGRPGQIDLVADIAETFETEGQQLAAIAPTGTGKAIGGLVPAVCAAINRGHRTVFSTESLALQQQILERDFPLIASVATSLTGAVPTIAVHKGFGNYVCLRALDSADPDLPGYWELQRWLGEGGHDGDRAQFPGTIDRRLWDEVSISSEECDANCPLAEGCFARNARERCRTADVVVTNHTMLGIQASSGAPIVFGSKLGAFRHLILDEAHGLPNAVRNQGAHQFSGESLRKLAQQTQRVIVDSSTLQNYCAVVDSIAALVDHALQRATKSQDVGTAVDRDVLEDAGDEAQSWLKGLASELAAAARLTFSDKVGFKLRRLQVKAQKLADALSQLRKPDSPMARWIDQDPHGKLVLAGSPVAVGGLLDANVYHHLQPSDDGEPVPVDLSVVAMSATLPVGFKREAGLQGAFYSHESPFDVAYQRSACYTPKLHDHDAAQVMINNRFDVIAHREWATWQIIDLVRANGGSALVLAATRASGEHYAAMLRSELVGVTTHSQWDGPHPSRIAATWRAEHDSVLVGTRSMMTGVDAPGETCSLVVLDRLPRAAGNPVDDARVQQLIDAEVVTNRWDGADKVYVCDAVLLAEQAAGRLIRSVDDVGMVAILDPRIAGGGKVRAYKRPVQAMLSPIVDRFGRRLTTIEDATAWLSDRHLQVDAA